MFIQSKISYIRQWTRQFLKIYYIQYNVFNNNEHNILHMVSETLISSVIQLKLDILLMKLQSYKARNSSTE